jgi:guanine deaminase
MMGPQELIHQAIQLALENVQNGSGGPFGALVARHGQIVASATNQVTSTLDPTAHAEVVAIRRACQALGQIDLSDCDLYCSCEPCPMCLGALYWARVAHVFFAAEGEGAVEAGFADLFIKEQICLPYDKQHLRIEQIRHQDALAPFLAWTGKADKIPY